MQPQERTDRHGTAAVIARIGDEHRGDQPDGHEEDEDHEAEASTSL